MEQLPDELLKKAPVIVIVPEDSHEALSRAFLWGAADVIPLGYDPFAMLRRIENIVELHLHQLHLEELVEEQAKILRHSNDAMVDALSSIIEYRSVLTEEVIGIISSAAALHDVGKISIPDAILTKPGKLTAEEMEIMKPHSLTGCRILESLGDLPNREYIRYAHNICHYHHERWDGGYPEGLRGDEIPICAQVVGLADVYDALTTKRVYKDALPFGTAVNMILKGECGAFSPKLLECFKHVVGQYEALARAYADGLAPESENFDMALPMPEPKWENNSVERVWAKYQALVHYCNVFLMELAQLESGMVLVTGTAGSGKSTTQACIIDRINRTRECHIVTLEDPIEFLHRHQRSIVSQREIAIDTQDYLSALRACVRQAPDVILLGEMRDPDTMHTAMSAAETGHTVIATLHTKGAVNAIDRIIDAFPSTQQSQIRLQLSTVLRTVVSQQLLPSRDGGLVPACEILQMTSAVRSLIRDNKNHQIDNVITSGGREGMMTMDQSIARLYQAGRITRETALHYADHPQQLERSL